MIEQNLRDNLAMNGELFGEDEDLPTQSELENCPACGNAMIRLRAKDARPYNSGKANSFICIPCKQKLQVATN